MFLLIVYDRIDTRRTVPPNDKECDGRNGPCACRYFVFDSKEIILFFKSRQLRRASGSAVARVRSRPVCNRRVPGTVLQCFRDGSGLETNARPLARGELNSVRPSGSSDLPSPVGEWILFLF